MVRQAGIVIDYEKRSWQEAIRICGDLMYSAGSVQHKYIEAMIDVVLNFGPYIVVAPHIAFAHADAKYALKDDLVLAVFKEPVIFGSHNDPVHLLFGLSAVESERHLEHLQMLSKILEDKKICEKLLNCTATEEVYKIINRKVQT